MGQVYNKNNIIRTGITKASKIVKDLVKHWEGVGLPPLYVKEFLFMIDGFAKLKSTVFSNSLTKFSAKLDIFKNNYKYYN